MNNQLYLDFEAYQLDSITNYYFKSVIVGVYENSGGIWSTTNSCYLNMFECPDTSYVLRLLTMRSAYGYVMEYE